MRREKYSQLGSPFKLTDIIDMQGWQRMQDNLSALTGISIRSFDSEGNAAGSPSGVPSLCGELIKDSNLKDKICGNCLPTFLGGKAMVDKNLSFTCTAGFCNFVAPVKFYGRLIGYVVVGPVVLVMRRQKEGYRKLAEELNIGLEDLWGAVLEVRVISFKGIQTVVGLVGDICEYIVNLAYRTKNMDMVIAMDADKIKKVLDILFEVAFEDSAADVGSVMFFDEKDASLVIRSAKGIPRAIVRKVKLKLGEGIAGRAAQEGKQFLIDENLADESLKPYLMRPAISSSMVIPINIKDKVIGVMNLGVLNTSSRRFNPDNVRKINKLINLATVLIS